MDRVVFHITPNNVVQVNYPRGVGTTWYGPYDSQEDAVADTRERIERLKAIEITAHDKQIREYTIQKTPPA